MENIDRTGEDRSPAGGDHATVRRPGTRNGPDNPRLCQQRREDVGNAVDEIQSLA
ncbi:hypothetical protein [Dactylosporangium sp. CA-139066]|uniref:hypothetical protein n=1 Tax=Dactylosporangium sp. CA-139066 TaxID=3239930 RepID=UPI003D8FA5F0